jgi:hypothetical protein
MPIQGLAGPYYGGAAYVVRRSQCRTGRYDSLGDLKVIALESLLVGRWPFAKIDSLYSHVSIVLRYINELDKPGRVLAIVRVVGSEPPGIRAPCTKAELHGDRTAADIHSRKQTFEVLSVNGVQGV